jgi:hypothetical protein
MPIVGPFPSMMGVLGYRGRAMVVLDSLFNLIAQVYSPSKGSVNSLGSC